MKVSTSVAIDAPLRKTFAVFADIGGIKSIVTGIDKIEILSNIDEGVGTRWRETRTMFGKEATEDMEITVLEENTSYTVEAESHGMYYKSVYEFHENNGFTHVDMTFEGIPQTLVAKLMTPIGLLFQGATKKALHQDMEDIKKYLES